MSKRELELAVDDQTPKRRQTSNSSFSDENLFQHATVLQKVARNSQPFKHLKIHPFLEHAFATDVHSNVFCLTKDEISALHKVEKETDIFKVNQTGDFQALADLVLSVASAIPLASIFN